MEQAISRQLFARAERVIPGGVNSPVRSFAAVGGTPPFIARARGSRLWDADGNEYIDYVGSWGPLILGHAHPAIVEALSEAAAAGSSYGAPTVREIELAELISSLMPSIEKLRLVNSGTEAAMTAVRLARAATGRSKFIKFEGCYHGHADPFLIRAGSGAATCGQPSSPGVTPGTAADTLSARFNDLESVESLLDAHRGQVAAVIVEPVAANMGVVPPETGFLDGLRTLTERDGAFLIFDEVITGFRLGLGGAQSHYGVRADLTVLGKVIGGGMPIGAIGGPADLMDRLAPVGPVYQAGTLSGNPMATASGLAQVRVLAADPGIYDRIERQSAALAAGFEAAVRDLDIPATINRVGSLLTLFFTSGPVTNWESATGADRRRFAAYFHGLLAAGIYLPPSPFEALFVSAAHTDADIARTVAAARAALAATELPVAAG